MPAAPRQPIKRAAAIARRWMTLWEPLCVIQSKREDDQAESFRTFREAYNRRIDHLLAAGIAWMVIHHGNLDSPLQTGTQFDRALCLAIERRRCRMNRRKGEGKKYAHRK
jgi:hypothetical protein